MGTTHTRRGDVLALALLCTAQFMLILDVVVVNVAVPSIRADLQVPDGAIQFVAVAYTVAFGSLLVAFGRAGDMYGRRRIFLAGLTVFTLASLAAGLAQTGWQLIASRAVQGVGAAMISPTALALLTTRFDEGPARNRALSLWGAVGAGGAIAGQLIGGILTEVAGWRSVFLINVPVGLLAIAAAAALLSEHRERTGARLDAVAAALLSGGLVPAVLAVTWLPQHGFTAGVAVALSAAALLLTGFALRQRRSSAPLIDVALLRRAGVRAGIGTLALSSAALTAGLFFTSLYLQVVVGHGALAVGLAFAPLTVLILLITPFSGNVVTRVGARPPLVIGMALMAAGLLWLSRVPPDGGYWTDVLPGLLAMAVGAGISYAPMFIAATTGVPSEGQGLTSGLLNTAQELGPAIGLAALAGVAAAVTAVPTAASLASGYRAGFLGAAVLVLAATFAAARMPRDVGRATPTAEAAATPVIGAA
jgi:EmrB/QacA subfamily drug resistance transporter